MTSSLIKNYGIVIILFLLCALFSILTIKEQNLDDDTAINQVLKKIEYLSKTDDLILTISTKDKPSGPFSDRLRDSLQERNFSNVVSVVGTPRDMSITLDSIKISKSKLTLIAASGDVKNWRIFENFSQLHPELSNCKIIFPTTNLWPDFLRKSNLVAIVDRIVVIAIIAIGMTMVIITGGIDLSVGSLIAVSAVLSTTLMKILGGTEASGLSVFLGFLVGIIACGALGCVGGLLVAKYKVPPFITTLGLMLMGRGLAFMITGGFSIYEVPKTLSWLGQGSIFGLANTLVLLIVLYFIAYLFMSHSLIGRYIYATGGNSEAAHISGVPVNAVIIFVYGISGVMAGIGGCVQASQLNTGTPNMGLMYELYVIAAVVVGGTSLSGGTGKILGTLIGAFIISVIQNGMNLLGIESYTQQVVLGLVILIAVLLDKASLQKLQSNH